MREKYDVSRTAATRSVVTERRVIVNRRVGACAGKRREGVDGAWTVVVESNTDTPRQHAVRRKGELKPHGHALHADPQDKLCCLYNAAISTH